MPKIRSKYRTVSKARRLRLCPGCHSTMVKFGFSWNNKQRWVCRSCGRTSSSPTVVANANKTQ